MRAQVVPYIRKTFAGALVPGFPANVLLGGTPQAVGAPADECNENQCESGGGCGGSDRHVFRARQPFEDAEEARQDGAAAFRFSGERGELTPGNGVDLNVAPTTYQLEESGGICSATLEA
jgi:hypothetical protein